ncbi:hypothetical protein L1887_54413 [Cichorium endivia]|nr:hypothetical protein L1887_54413 [Cichorium endivia]
MLATVRLYARTMPKHWRTSYQYSKPLFTTLVLHTQKDIRQNPQFRAEFARMCNAIGVDPLAGSNVKGASTSNGKASSVWAKMLGSSVNDFYFELAVRVVEVCRETRAENGGMIAVSEMRKRIEKGRALSGLTRKLRKLSSGVLPLCTRVLEVASIGQRIGLSTTTAPIQALNPIATGLERLVRRLHHPTDCSNACLESLHDSMPALCGNHVTHIVNSKDDAQAAKQQNAHLAAAPTS